MKLGSARCYRAWPGRVAGVYDVPLTEGFGRSFLEDGTELSPDRAIVVVKPDGSVRTAYPYHSAHPR